MKAQTQTLTIDIVEMMEIHAIACSAWKTKIAKEYLPRIDAKQTITFSSTEVNEMFKAATDPQKQVLEKIFGKQKPPIDFSKLRTGSKVMIKHTGHHCGGISSIRLY